MECTLTIKPLQQPNFKWAIHGLIYLYFRLFLSENKCLNKLPITGFEPRSTSVGSNNSANCTTTLSSPILTVDCNEFFQIKGKSTDGQFSQAEAYESSQVAYLPKEHHSRNKSFENIDI